ncbi:MAG: adenosylcobinamide-phosphate synthase CbiB [Hyphomicrobiales bacterium]|nr:adenosylcobinamide-phosphate synthase CbiB [Hyphomicrobiales bacterium]
MIFENTETLAFVLLLAVLLDGIFADPPCLYRIIPHPIALLGRGIGWFEGQLNRDSHTSSVKFLLGMGASLALIVLVFLFGWLLMELLDFPGGWIVEALMVSTLLAGRGLYDQVAACADALKTGSAAGREALVSLVGRDPRFLDESGIAKAAIESLGENFSDAVVAPLFWGILLGIPGLLAYKAINTLDSMLGYVSSRYFWFGKFAARLDDVANFIPARLSALLVCLAAMTMTKTSWRGALSAVVRDAHRHTSWNAGYPEAAFAGAMHIAIAGPRRSTGGEHHAAWMGKGRTNLTTADIRISLRLYLRAWILAGGMLGFLAL